MQEQLKKFSYNPKDTIKNALFFYDELESQIGICVQLGLFTMQKFPKPFSSKGFQAVLYKRIKAIKREGKRQEKMMNEATKKGFCIDLVT